MYKDIHVQVTDFRGSVMVHLRVKDPETGRFTSTGIALTAAEWMTLEGVWARIDENLRDYQLTPYAAELGERGRRVTVRRFKEKSFVDIRSFFTPPDSTTPRPTRRGVMLNVDAWSLLRAYLPLVRRDMRAVTIRIAEQGVDIRELTRDRLLAEAARLREQEEAGEGTSGGLRVGKKRTREEAMSTALVTTTHVISTPKPRRLRRPAALKLIPDEDVVMSQPVSHEKARETLLVEDMECSDDDEDDAATADTQPIPDSE